MLWLVVIKLHEKLGEPELSAGVGVSVSARPQAALLLTLDGMDGSPYVFFLLLRCSSKTFITQSRTCLGTCVAVEGALSPCLSGQQTFAEPDSNLEGSGAAALFPLPPGLWWEQPQVAGK